ncbi:hypothetical protein WOLCODRAFT_148865 [Wolfiporia cocos MD-104 SS10]|uniref:Arrestin C-terminal-like domain-containing protein n=1 Tax=Wolfiporia cocos (strain MD-104) TaxID=742152 RepID=A0A2H3J6R4_WOLCO|nr:hypothetical protein WOLCODRAFT_148865 [Wolfiporia cocos MD-104 SS10]
MSVAKLTLRPPPNIDFVQGYPGIPPGPPDRSQAAVKGAIEVRVGAQAVKAKWVRIELRRVETLPGGGVANTFYDFVGQSPISVWQANEEYGMLEQQDFPFYIRIPESIPPSIALEKGALHAAGIKYELIATVCVKGKKGLFRRDKPSLSSTSTTIIIDKHELHSTWPIYQQPEKRSHEQGGVTLTVDRERTCYGPGDRIVVLATVRTDALHTGILRGFEFALREAMVFTPKRGAPLRRESTIGEQKVPVNVTLYGGMQHRAELTTTIPADHTTATINTARHIDVTYTLAVKALMNTGQDVALELPVIVSNWPRHVSQQAMQRIGIAPNVSATGQAGSTSASDAGSHAPPAIGQHILNTKSSFSNPVRPSTAQSHPYAASSEVDIVIGRPSAGQYNTAPTDKAFGSSDRPDEFGLTRPASPSRGASLDRNSSVGSTERSSSYVMQTVSSPQGLAAASGRVAEPAVIARPRASSARATGSRLTVTNLNEQELAEYPELQQMQAQIQAPRPRASAQGQSASRSRWMTAEEEKRKLYETAVANVERVQGEIHPRSSTTQNASSAPSVTTDSSSTPAPSNVSTPSKPNSHNRWPTAEEEKRRLFESAQERVARMQGMNGSATGSPPPSSHGRSDSVASSQPATSSPGASASAGGSAPTQSRSPPVKSQSLQYSSAEEEKAALRRYYDAKAAVERTHNAAYGMAPQSPPVLTAYDALYPKSDTTVSSPPVNDSPPAFVPSSSQPSYLSEKERLRRAYEAQDAAAAASPNMPPISAVAPQQQFVPPVVPSSPPPMAMPKPQWAPTAISMSVPVATTPQPAPSTPMSSAAAEKEMLRRRFEAQDAASRVANGPPAPPPRAVPHTPPTPPTTGSRPIPTPPRSPAVSRPLTAAEEKARLKAQYEADDRAAQPQSYNLPVAPAPMFAPMTNGFHRQDSMSPPAELIPPPAPPPLAPRPPKEYILETQEEDMRNHARLQAIDKEISTMAGPLKSTDLILSSFAADLVDSNGHPIPTPGPPPPIPSPPRLPNE